MPIQELLHVRLQQFGPKCGQQIFTVYFCNNRVCFEYQNVAWWACIHVDLRKELFEIAKVIVSFDTLFLEDNRLLLFGSQQTDNNSLVIDYIEKMF